MQQERDYQNIVSLCWKAGATHDSFITSLTKLLPCPASRELSSSWAAVTLALAAAELRHPALGAPHNTRTRKLFLPGRGAEGRPDNENSRNTTFRESAWIAPSPCWQHFLSNNYWLMFSNKVLTHHCNHKHTLMVLKLIFQKPISQRCLLRILSNYHEISLMSVNGEDDIYYGQTCTGQTPPSGPVPVFFCLSRTSFCKSCIFHQNTT